MSRFALSETSCPLVVINDSSFLNLPIFLLYISFPKRIREENFEELSRPGKSISAMIMIFH